VSPKFTRIFYATDVHGSEICFRKFLGAATHYKAEVLILGGDVTGKAIVPIIQNADGTYKCNFAGKEQVAKTKEEAQQIENKVRDSGYYVHYSTPDEAVELQNDKERLDKLFLSVMQENLLRWVQLAEDHLKGTSVICYITGGNDDHQETMDAVKDLEHVKNPDNKVVKIDEIHEMANLGWGNPTPWNCPRDLPSEEELGKVIQKLIDQVKDMPNCIFNFHVPPIDCGLDSAPQLDASVFPPKPVVKGGQQVIIGVGSSSIRTAVEKLQPLLVLSGHIHESRGTAKIGKTLIINPGSEYPEGVLRGAIVNVGDKKVLSYQLTSG